MKRTHAGLKEHIDRLELGGVVDVMGTPNDLKLIEIGPEGMSIVLSGVSVSAMYDVIQGFALGYRAGAE